MATKLTALDLAFLSLEKQTTPVNVASLAIIEIPQGYDGNYPRDILKKLESQPAGPPFNQKLSAKHVASMPSWITDEHFDIHYHVRHSALPKPGTEEDLMELVSRLHGRLLDRERPLWEFHLIEGLEGNRVAMYMKMHHACIDGMGGVELMENCFSLTDQEEVIAPWSEMQGKTRVKNKAKGGLVDAANRALKQMSNSGRMVFDLSKMVLGQGLKVAGLKSSVAPAPFTAPKSIFNVPITTTRRFAVKSMSLSDIKAIGKQAGATVNDMILEMCSGALREYMKGKGELPQKPLIATVPVSVRQLNRTGNQITYVMANLATHEADPLKRLSLIESSTKGAKQEVQQVCPDAATSFAVVAQGLTAVINHLNIAGFVPPPANVTISNVPGPRQPLFFGDAKLSAMYPLSVLIDGQSLNITVVSYCDTVSFGFMACRDIIPDVNELAASLDESLTMIKGRLKMDEMLGRPLAK